MTLQDTNSLVRYNPGRMSRRSVIKAIGAAGLIIGVTLPELTRTTRAADVAASIFAPNAFVRVAPNNVVTLMIKSQESGQGATTGLATLLVEEMDADWAQVRTEYAPANDALYKNLFVGMQMTGGSSSIANAFEQMRQAGATARAMLVAAAAKAWKVRDQDVLVSKGVLKSGTHQASFGEMAMAAAALPVPTDVPLKTPDRFFLIGKPLQRLDSRAKSNGTAIYTIDVKLPGLLTAVTAHPPKFGARVKSFDASKALAIRGVKKVVQIPEGVAVIAEGMWPAIKGRNALQITWDDSKAETRSSADLVNQYKALLAKPGASALRIGDTAKGFAGAKTVIEAEYEFPYLAHAPLEPVNCVIQLKNGTAQTWAGHLTPTLDQRNVAKALGLAPEKVTVNTLISGGSFGRRGTPESEFLVEAAHIAKASGLDVPIRLQRTREDDMRAGYYRPLYVHRLKAALDNQGKLIAWSHRIVGQSIIAGTFWAHGVKGADPKAVDGGTGIQNGVDPTSVQGAADIPYSIPNMAVDLHSPTTRVPVLSWRSVGASHTTYAVETMLDELAAAAKKDPLAFRLALLKDKPRQARALQLAADKAGWGSKLPAGTARGIAFSDYAHTSVAHVVEIHLEKDGSIKVDRLVVAVDCGQVVNPDIVRSQMEGGAGWGLSAALYSELTLDQGAVTQGNFNGFQILRIDRMPKVEVHIVNSSDPPTGIGECGAPPIAPAVANAIAALTGKRIRILPMAKTDLKKA